MARRPVGDRDELLKKLHTYLAQPRTMTQLTKKLGVGERSVYGYLSDLEGWGHKVARVGMKRPYRYQIL